MESKWSAHYSLKVIAMRGFLLEVKDQDHHSPNGDRKFRFWLIRGAWNVWRLFCIISGELILLIQCMEIRFIETFIKAFRVHLISTERPGSEMEIWSVSHLSQLQQSLGPSGPCLPPLFMGAGCCFRLQWRLNGVVEASSVGKRLSVFAELSCKLADVHFLFSHLLCCLGNKLQGFFLFDRWKNRSNSSSSSSSSKTLHVPTALPYLPFTCSLILWTGVAFLVSLERVGCACFQLLYNLVKHTWNILRFPKIFVYNLEFSHLTPSCLSNCLPFVPLQPKVSPLGGGQWFLATKSSGQFSVLILYDLTATFDTVATCLHCPFASLTLFSPNFFVISHHSFYSCRTPFPSQWKCLVRTW